MASIKPPSVEELIPQNFPPLSNDRIIKAANGQNVEKIPIWIMRQAGRYLPEYHALRVGHNFFEICRTPELACEVTLMPIRRFDLDAAVIFSDILVIPQALGVDVEMKPGGGLVFNNLLNEPRDLSKLTVKGSIDRLKYVGQAITVTRHRLNGKVPLIGFSGGPWTLMSYMIDGSSRTYANAKTWLYKHPDASKSLLDILTKTVADYVLMQIESGAQLIQIFDSNVKYLNEELFNNWVKPCLKTIREIIKKKHSEIPVILFCKGSHFCLAGQKDLGYNVLGVDWTVDPLICRKLIGNDITLQGNLDPCALHTCDETEFVDSVTQMVNKFGRNNYIANLGDGIYPNASIDGVKLLIDTVHSL